MNMQDVLRVGLLSALCCSGCSTTGKVSSIPGIGFETEPLKRSEYEILGVAKGEACAEERCSFGGCRRQASTRQEELYEGHMQTSNLKVAAAPASSAAVVASDDRLGPSGSEIAERIAMFKAIDSVPKADALILPRKSIDITRKSFLGIFVTTKSCVRITGKAVRLKSDAELAGGFATPAPPAKPTEPAKTTEPVRQPETAPAPAPVTAVPAATTTTAPTTALTTTASTTTVSTTTAVPVATRAANVKAAKSETSSGQGTH